MESFTGLNGMKKLINLKTPRPSALTVIKKLIYRQGVIALLLCPALVHAYGPYHADAIRVVDGDTVSVKLHLFPGLFKTIKVRLDKIDTPEKRSSRYRTVPACEKELAKLATKFTEQWLSDKPSIIVSDIRTGVYAGRVIGEISYNGELLREALIENGHAREYIARVEDREDWCND